MFPHKPAAPCYIFIYWNVINEGFYALRTFQINEKSTQIN